jgi:hypothetical protein
MEGYRWKAIDRSEFGWGFSIALGTELPSPLPGGETGRRLIARVNRREQLKV